MDDLFAYGEGLKERRRVKYAAVIFLPSALNSAVAPLREQFDPLYNLIASHITLVFPFDTNRPLEDLAQAIQKETEKQRSFLVGLDSVGDFYPKAPAIYWNIQDSTPLCELYFRLYSALEVPIPFRDYVPHVTVAREISQHRVIIVKEKIASYLPRDKFYASSVDLVTPLVDQRWVSVRTFPFRGSATHPPSV